MAPFCKICQIYLQGFRINFLLWIFVFSAILFCPLLAWSSVESGKVWLVSQVANNGSIVGQNSSLALATQVQSETARTLDALGVAVPAALLKQIQQTPQATTEYLSRYRFASHLEFGPNAGYLAELAILQNEDGGFGAAEGYASNPVDTAWALLAWVPSQVNTPAAQNAVSWLLNNQRNDGSWFVAADESGIVSTALAVEALQHYRAYTGVSAAQSRARSWLDSQKQANQGWGRADYTAHALLALLPGQTNASAYAETVAQLEAIQLANGSWQNDSYITALVLRALWLASQPVTNPDFASVRGVVIDGASGHPIQGAQITLQNSAVSVISDENGAFLMSGLTAGADVLTVSASGYRVLTANMQLQVAQTVDFGSIRLSAASGPGSDNVVVSGIARFVNEGRTYNASGATISVGSLTTLSNALGEYQLEGVPPGAGTITATYGSYPALTANFNALADQHIRFDPLFSLPATNAATLVTVLTNQENGLPVANVSVRLNGATPYGTIRYSNANGEATFASGYFGLRVGENTIEVAATGFEGQIIKFVVPSGQDVTLPVALKPATVTDRTILQGVVTDAATRFPVAGATVTIDGVAGMVTQTDAQGRYQFSSPPSYTGAKKIIFEKAGYYTHEQTIQIVTNRTHNLDIPLQPLAQSGSAANLNVTVSDRSTGTPLPGVVVTLTGTNSHTVTTDAAGNARIEGLNAGDTQILVTATGFEGVFANVSVVSGRQYQLPLELAPQTGASIRLFGTVLDASSQQPLAGAQVTLTGVGQLTAVADANGEYEFDGIPTGSWQLAATFSGYQSFSYPVSIVGTTEANIPLQVDYGTGDPAWLNWGIFATIVDADTFETISGAHILAQELQAGQAVLSESSTTSQSNGGFEFSGFVHDNVRLFITMPGYDSIVVPLARTTQATQFLGSLLLKRSYVATLPDLQLGAVDRATLLVDPYSFVAKGQVSAEVVNSSNYNVGAFDVVLFEDVNLDGEWQADTDKLLDRVRVNGLPQQAHKAIHLEVDGAQLAFRDAPLYVMVDASHEVIESFDGNNTRRAGVSCSGGGGMQDVAICVDVSGSVSNALYQIEMDGVIAALENPNIIPHDGSIRFTLDMAHHVPPRYQAVVVSPSTLPQLIHDLRTYPRHGEASSGARCTRFLSEYLKTLPPSTRKTIITIGDGAWEGAAFAESMLPGTIANGIARIDAIGVGSVSASAREQLEANVWPKPANSPNGGLVTITNSTGEVAAAIARAIAASVQSADLTLGNFRLIDQGVGQPIKLAMRVGNAGSASQASTVEVWQGSTLLGTLSVPPLKSGEWIDLELESTQIQGTELLRAIVDPAVLNAECNLANNSQDIPIAAANTLASITVYTDSAVYPADTPVTLSGVVSNLGGFDASLWVALQIVDADGVEVIRFNGHDLGLVPSDGSAVGTQPWNTASFQAGIYTLRGQVLDQFGNVLDRDSTIFAISAGSDLTSPTAALNVSTDKAVYRPSDRVRIDSLVRNLTQNAHVDDARVELSVASPDGTIVFVQTLDIGQLTAGGLRALDTAQLLQDAVQGEYIVTARLFGSAHGNGMPGVNLATATARYQVTPLGLPGPAPNPGGSADYAVQKSTSTPMINVGDQAAWSVVVTNNGPQDGQGVRVEDLIPAGLSNVSWVCAPTGQASCSINNGTGDIQLDAQVYSGAGNYLTIVITGDAQAAGVLKNEVRISAINGGVDRNSQNNQADASVTVMSGGASVTPVPMNQSWAMALMTLSLLLLTGGVLRRRQAKP